MFFLLDLGGVAILCLGIYLGAKFDKWFGKNHRNLRAIYHKLGVHSQDEALTKMGEIGAQSMKVWWVLGWEQYEACGGLGNVHGAYETKEEAEAVAASLMAADPPLTGCDNYNVEVCNVSDLLGLRTK